MKKLIFIFVLLCPIFVNASVVVMDSDTNRVLYGINEREQHLVASTTKIMTAMVVINNSNLDETITVTDCVLRSFGSGIYIEIGEKISIRDLLYGLMLRSGNDAAIMLAEYVGGSEEGFAVMMNELASSLGMKQTNFINASGLENDKGEGNISTPYDMALLMSYAIKNTTFKKITSTYHYMVKTNYKTYDWYNKNKLLKMYEYTTGGKTGYTEKAYRTLVTSATKDKKNLVIVTLGEKDDFNIHKNLYESIFNKYEYLPIINKRTFMKEDKMYVENDFSMLLTNEEKKNINIEFHKTNDAIKREGYVTVSLNGNEYYRDNVYKKVKNNKNEKMSLWEKIKVKLSSLFK